MSAPDSKKLASFLSLFQQLEDELLELSNDERNYLLESHKETATIPHCVRWGLQASEELVEQTGK